MDASNLQTAFLTASLACLQIEASADLKSRQSAADLILQWILYLALVNSLILASELGNGS